MYADASHRQHLNAREFERAIEIVEKAQKTYQASEFQEAVEEYQEYLPIDLADCYVLDSGGGDRYVGGDAEDTFGNSYSNTVRWNSYRDSYVIFYTNGKYQRLSGTIAPYDCASNAKGYVTILADDKEVFKSSDIRKTVEPTTFDVDIGTCSQLKIVFSADGRYWCGAIIDAKLS